MTSQKLEIDSRLTPQMLVERLNRLFEKSFVASWQYRRADDVIGVIVTPVILEKLTAFVVSIYVRDADLETPLAIARDYLACRLMPDQVSLYWNRDQPSIVIPTSLSLSPDRTIVFEVVS